MSAYLYSDKSDCKNCYKCIRHCPVKSIRFEKNQAHIMQDDCILCGKCYNICPQKAKVIQDDTIAAKKLIRENDKVIVSLAPSYAAYFPGISFETIKKTLTGLGFYDVEETAIGAEMVKNQYEDLIREKKQNVLISSCCPSINLMIQKYYPEALPYLAKVMTPLQAHCTFIKDKYENAKTVFVGPCISKKSEVEGSSNVDCVLTFEDLKKWFENDGIQLENEGFFDAPEAGKSRIFPTPGGILKSMNCYDKDTDYIALDGIDQCILGIKDIINGNLSNCFVEMSACHGSCIGGPIMAERLESPIQSYVAVNKTAGSKDFDITYDFSISRDYPFLSIGASKPGTYQINEILKKMGKTKPEDELNCGSCGYNTCREKAVAIHQGKATYTMCLPFLIGKAENFSDNIINNTPNGIIVLDEELYVQQINKSACRIMSIPNAMSVLGEPAVRILDPTAFVHALDQKKEIYEESVYLGEYEKYVDQTIIYDESYHILICIMRDITEESKARERKEVVNREAIDTANHVVEKQMRIVQEIASLLGESTAETKIALTKLKESLSNE